MIKANNEKYSAEFRSFFEKCISLLSEQYRFKPLFGGMFSSTVWGYDGKTSDLDFYLIIDSGDSGFNKKSFFIAEMNLEIVSIDIKYLLHENNCYKENVKKFPSVIFKGLQDNCNHAFLFDDYFTCQKFFEILISDFIWDSGFLKNNYFQIVHYINDQIVLDYYFTRAYGTLHNYLIKQMVPAKRYIRAFINYGIMRFLLEEDGFPEANVDFLIVRYCPDKFKVFLQDLINKIKNNDVYFDISMHTYDDVRYEDMMEMTREELKNVNAEDKQEITIECNAMFNRWFESALDRIKTIISNMNE